MLRELDLAKLNSLTKYPSILTYHGMGENGSLTDEILVAPQGTMIATEKVAGTNSRIICLPDKTFVIGSREELLHARGDVIWNPALGIVDALRPTAERLVTTGMDARDDALWVFYLEVFGGKVTASSKQYTGEQRVGWRLFDVMSLHDYRQLFEQSVEGIARWRDNGGQSFRTEAELQAAAKCWGFELTPRIPVESVPTGHVEVLEWLQRSVPETQCRLDGKGQGRAEGVVVRNSDRSVIFKIRFEDYERHLRRQTKARG
jgi:hypothetical protein